ncbi:MAG TPA: signal peptide peptidase SppA [Pirellulales bacterium]|nr:signal peptide peptidase SppA [Pirellulales bacterium]
MRPFLILATAFSLAIASAAPGIAADTKKSSKNKPIVAVFRLRGPIVETPAEENFLMGTSRSVTLHSLIERMSKAREDENVKAVVITLDGATVTLPQAEEIRQRMADIRAAGKDVYLCADGLTMQDFVLAAGASEISVVPTGDLWLTGYYAESPYLRGLLDKISVTPDFLHCGDYKSASETFMRDGPSQQAEEMQNWLLDSEYQTTIQRIAQGRGVDEATVRGWIDGGPYTAEKARELRIIDRVQQRNDLEAALKEKFGDQIKFDPKYAAKASGQIDFSSPMGMMNFYAELLGGGKKKKSTKDTVAIINVEGAIVLGSADASPLSFGGKSAGSTPIRKALDDAAADDAVKAVVLRIDSPGGSATASDVILAATKRLKAKKPLVVSMGNVAASGGYYVSCASDVVYADEATITGSIGVVGGKLATSGLWNKVGINWKGYGRGVNASIMSSSHPFTDSQRTRMQSWMDDIYGVFKGHVVTARGTKLKKPIDELAGGRVYTGRQALDLGLVDRIGTLHDAIKEAAEQAKIEKYEVRLLPEPKTFLQTLLGSALGEEDEDTAGVSLSAAFGVKTFPLLDAVLPYLRELDGQRLGAVLTALGRLELIHREGVVLMMPEIVIR